MTQAITDVINLILLDRGLGNYINNFEIHMLPPTTQEEKDRRDNTATRMGFVNDIMNLLGDIDDVSTKLRILKSLLSGIVTDDEVTQILQEYIDYAEAEKFRDEEVEAVEEDDETDANVGFDGSTTSGFDETQPMSFGNSDAAPVTGEYNPTDFGAEPQTEPTETSSTLPSPSDIDADFTTM